MLFYLENLVLENVIFVFLCILLTSKDQTKGHYGVITPFCSEWAQVTVKLKQTKIKKKKMKLMTRTQIRKELNLFGGIGIDKIFIFIFRKWSSYDGRCNRNIKSTVAYSNVAIAFVTRSMPAGLPRIYTYVYMSEYMKC